MAFEGYVDAASSVDIRGWIFDDSKPNDPLKLEILSEGRVVATILADQFREDLKGAKKGNGLHAFSFAMESIPSSMPLVARIVGKPWLIPSAGAPRTLPMRFERQLVHSLEYGIPELEGAFSTSVRGADEQQIVKRIIDAFHRAVKADPKTNARQADVWSEVGDFHHAEIIRLLKRRDVSGVVDYLRDAHAKGLTFGISQGRDTTAALREFQDARQLVLLQQMDKLVSLAEYLGVMDVESPEQHGQWAENFYRDPQMVIDKISQAIGIQVITPQVMGSAFGLKTSAGVFTGRDATALYAALRLKAISTDLGLKAPDICEIGGGLGTVAYYAALLIPCKYTIIDLPLVSLLQAYTLYRALPNIKLSLFGEPEEATADFRLLPTFCFSRPDRQYDILFNQDSMPEMHPDYSLAYLRQARNNVKHAFLSINQEARATSAGIVRQTVVRELVAKTGGFRMITRNRHWLQAGYVEEFYLAEK